MEKVFVTSVTGAQGKAIAEIFHKEGYLVSSLVRKTSNNLGHFDVTVGEFHDIATLASAMTGSKAIVLTLPLLFDSTEVVEITENIIAAAKQAKVGKIIYNSSIPLGNSKTGYAALDVKHDALNALKNSGLKVITLMPTIYLDNLASPFLLPVIQQNNIIPYPISEDVEFSWVSYENLGRYCVAAVNNDQLIDEKILITNKDKITKSELAQLISSVANKEIKYIATAPSEFEKNLIPVLGEYVAKEIANLYRGVAENKADFINYTHQDFLESVTLQSTREWVDTIDW